MKYFRLLLVAVVVTLSFSNCGGKKNGSSDKETTAESVADIQAKDNTIYGVCGEGSAMNTLQLITDSGDTLTLSTTQCGEAGLVFGGLNNGDKLAVLIGNNNAGEKVATQIINLTSLLGNWVQPNPIDGSDVQGIKLQDGGIATGINMGSTEYKAWKIFNGRLLVTASTGDNGDGYSGEEETDTFTIMALGPDSLVIKNSADTYEYSRQK